MYAAIFFICCSLITFFERVKSSFVEVKVVHANESHLLFSMQFSEYFCGQQPYVVMCQFVGQLNTCKLDYDNVHLGVCLCISLPLLLFVIFSW